MSEALSLRGKRGNAARNTSLTPKRRSELAKVAAAKRWEGHSIKVTLSASTKARTSGPFCLRKNGRVVRWFKTLGEAMTAFPGVAVDRHAEQAALSAAGHGRYNQTRKREE